MSRPAYHLRPNKAIDRLIMVDTIRRLEQFGGLQQYTYYGLGGPYLEDFRILYELSKDIGMVSIEINKEVLKRQAFHRPSRTVRLRCNDLAQFIDEYEPHGKSIFWLDYTKLRYGYFESFKLLITKVFEGSVVKISLRADPRDFIKEPERFGQRFRNLMENPSSNPPAQASEYAKFIQDMLRVAVQQALPRQLGIVFQPITSFFYSDGTGMLTLTGIVCSVSEVASFRSAFANWHLSNLYWSDPRHIDVPFLSTKERLHLQDKLPCVSSPGQTLLDALGYSLEGKKERTRMQLAQYADFHRHYPYFIKAVP